MKVETETNLKILGSAEPVRQMNRVELLDSIMAMFAVHPELRFKTIERIEYMKSDELREAPVAGTLFEPIVTRLNMLMIPTEPTLGGIMNSLELTETDVHDLGCACLGAEVNSATIMCRVERLKFFQ